MKIIIWHKCDRIVVNLFLIKMSKSESGLVEVWKYIGRMQVHTTSYFVNR